MDCFKEKCKVWCKFVLNELMPIEIKEKLNEISYHQGRFSKISEAEDYRKIASILKYRAGYSGDLEISRIAKNAFKEYKYEEWIAGQDDLLGTIIKSGNKNSHSCLPREASISGAMRDFIKGFDGDQSIKEKYIHEFESIGQNSDVSDYRNDKSIQNTKISMVDTSLNTNQEKTASSNINISGNTGRNIAKNLCIKQGYNITKPFNLASLNQTSNFYWANPNPEYLRENWWLILNDNKKHELHIFYIPANSLTKGIYGQEISGKIGIRDNELLDIQIEYGDTSFEIKNGNVKLKQFYRGTITY